MINANSSYSIALLVPVYNGEKYIGQFHQTILELDTSFDEIIFYNDGSTDGSYEKLMALGYRVINGLTNNGVSYARNQLIKNSVAEWVHFHDIDDFICSNYLKIKARHLQGNYDAIFCDCDWINANTYEIIIRWRYLNSELKKNDASYLLTNPVGGINGLYKRNTLIEINGFDENLKIWEDADLNLRLFLHSKKIHFVERVLVKSFRNDVSTTSNDLLIQKYKCIFLNKHKNIKNHFFKKALVSEANNLYHRIVYEKYWELYDIIVALFADLNITPPVTKKKYLNIFKWLLGSKNFTLLKYHFLKNIKGLKI